MMDGGDDADAAVIPGVIGFEYEPVSDVCAIMVSLLGRVIRSCVGLGRPPVAEVAMAAAHVEESVVGSSVAVSDNRRSQRIERRFRHPYGQPDQVIKGPRPGSKPDPLPSCADER
jgi:hypothetical protein